MDEMSLRGMEYKTLFVGQHDMLHELSDYYIRIDDVGNRLNSIVASVMSNFPTIAEDDITSVMVQGDTTTALAVAMAANHSGIRVIHLEAGLRTYDNENPWPEEGNRRMISAISDINLCPTGADYKNLIRERVQGKSWVVGNTVTDSLVKYTGDCSYDDIVLVTLHRRENHPLIREWFIAIEQLAREYREIEFILPIHPNPDVKKHSDVFKQVGVVKPMDHDTFLTTLSKAKLVITDSGGLQEECSFLNKKCLVCRKKTERSEVVGKSSFMVDGPGELKDVFDRHIDDYYIDYPCPYGTGDSAKRVVDLLTDMT